MEGGVEGPSLPSNYVTIQQLKERWLQQQNHRQNPPTSNSHHHKPDPQLNPNPNDDPPLKRLPRRKPNRRRVIKPDVAVSGSESGSGSGFKPQMNVADNHPKVDKEKKEHSNSNSKLPNKKNSHRGRKPRSSADQNPNGDGTPLLEPEPVVDKIQTQKLGLSRNRNQNEVRDHKDKGRPREQNDGRGHGGVDDVAFVAAVDVANVSEGRSRVRGFERPQVKQNFRHWKPPLEVKKGQTSVWVRKGESAAN